MATKKTVCKASDATELPGRPSAELVRMSKAVGTGIVSAWCKKDTWYYIAPSEVNHYRLHLGVTATMVYVTEV